ncbi:hypothetical protein P7C70_g1694, partial [Phenoliferia sp. Uapishka_3]
MADTPIVVRASREQYLATVTGYSKQWAYGLSAADYTKREAEVISSLPFSSEMQCWVLVPSSSPTTSTSILSSLELRPVPILVSSAGQQARSELALVVNKLYTPDQHRKKGYAKLLLEHVHRVARSMRGDGGKGGVVMSFLHSDVGDFYKRFGWYIPKSSTNFDTTWTVEELSPSMKNTSSTNLRPLALSDLRLLLPLDTSLISSFLSTPSPHSIRLAIEPTFASHESSITRALFDMNLLRPTLSPPKVWGFESSVRESPNWAFLTFTLDLPRSILRILRFRPPSSSSPEDSTIVEALIRATVQVARECGLENVVAWNMDQGILGRISEEWRGETGERELPLAALAWYGEGDGLVKEKGEGIELEFNEAFGSY